MSEYALIVSHPPHGDIDLAKAVPCFRLTRAEVQMKANYGLPEIWFAGQDRRTIEPTFDALRDAGLAVIFVSGEVLRSVPEQLTASEVEFSDRGLVITIDGSPEELSDNTELIGVVCEPRREPAAATRPSKATAMGRLSHTGLTPDTLVGRSEHGPAGSRAKDATESEYAAFVDLYMPANGSVRRISFVEGQVDLSGIGAGSRSTAKDLKTLADQLEARFSHATFDRRPMGMRIRRRILVGEYPHDERRKGYSFATRALSQLLEAISPDIKRITEAELASRLAYLTQREASGA
jgi:hypothetical protein